MWKMIKAVGLLSGGLDSTLAARVMLDQGVEVHAINFFSPFCTCTPKSAGCPAVVTAIRNLGGISLKRVVLGDEYLEMVQHPKHGYGRGMNPCLDCRIMKLKKAGEYMREIGASFLFTGEVLGQRPMSQHRSALKIIDEGSGLGSLTLRPLSALHLEPTAPELEGWVNRAQLLDISGRTRRRQMELADEAGIKDYPCPAGGCLLTDKNFAGRMRDYFRHTDKPSIKDIALLKVGRHHRLQNGDKIIIARNEDECRVMKQPAINDYHLIEPDFTGPVVILQGNDVPCAMAYLLHHTQKTPARDATVRHSFMGRSERIAVSRAATIPAPASES
jgi:tRNA U34 2-thiouridine synthase MnmA/TrmU